MPNTDINTNLDQMMKNFDPSALSKIGYKDIQDLAQKYLANPDPVYQKFGKMLQEIDPKDFELSPAEQKVREIHDYFTKSGKKASEADEFCAQILAAASNSTIDTILIAMSDETRASWEQLNTHDINVYQKIFVLNQTAKMLLNKEFDEIYEESLLKAVELTVSTLSNGQLYADMVQKLNDDQIQQITSLLDEGKFENASQLIFQFVKNND